ncbi:MAG: NAD(P)H-hydrate dehydratase [Dehalococcoidia bacterium]|nr:NAD(P)H-hydrate dehydratase [Dehalococcoidia bacterium]
MKIVTSDQMRTIDHRAAEAGIATSFLMENAGRAVADETRGFVDYIAGRIILVLAGPGNNGGDALVAARHLHEWGADVSIYLLSERSPQDKNLALAKQHGIPLAFMHKDVRYAKLKNILSTAEVVIDGILGTGRARPLEGRFKETLDMLNFERRRRPQLITVAIDIPTGMNADTGAMDQSCLKADLTITLGLPKPGLYSFPGAGMAGKVVVADIGIPERFSRNIKTELITSEWARSALPARPASANKGTFGRVLAVVGSENYVGAAYLACMGAARVGAGVVTLSTAKSLQPILASKLTEVTYAPLPETTKGTLSAKASSAILSILPYYRVLLMGCGLGQHPHTRNFVRNVLTGLPENPPVLILDADALNIVADMDGWWKQLPTGTVVTPHAGEMSRLMGLSIEKLQSNRLEMCRKAAAHWGKIVVLKGAYTIIADPVGRVRISDYASAGLASAGTGDVLAGAIAGLAGQGMPLFDAAVLGVYLHAAAGEMVKREMGDAGMLATDLLPALPKAIRELKEKRD